MKKYILFLMCVLFGLQSTIVKAEYGPEGKQFGLGVYLGEPTGVTGKFYFAEKISFQGIGSWSFYDEGVTLVGDVLFDVYDLSQGNSDYSLPVYVGVGAKLALNNKNSNDDSTFGAHFPVGIAWHSMNVPIEIAFELTPGMDVSPATEFDMGGGIAFRFYF